MNARRDLLRFKIFKLCGSRPRYLSRYASGDLIHRRRMKIDYLANHPDFIPTLSKWFLREWRDFYGDKTWEDVAETFYERLNRDSIPLSLVAFEEQHPFGTISLLGVLGTSP